MCFSAKASFITAAGLSLISLLSYKKASPKPRMIPLAISPLFFALQQACEGIVWLTIAPENTNNFLYALGMYGFLFFATCWWPIWIPTAFLCAEKSINRKKWLSMPLYVGCISALLLLCSWVLKTQGAHVINHHLDYPVTNYPFDITDPFIANIIIALIAGSYCIATITPFFISTISYAWILGIVVSIGLLISYIFYYIAFPSVWCFFAAISSVLLYMIL
ncbi:MAG TPA: DUF6629 family protein [Candidatus Babeliales bacterium]|nr:DUF6629 family protein [Candidatus Babeliales bacterium]